MDTIRIGIEPDTLTPVVYVPAALEGSKQEDTARALVTAYRGPGTDFVAVPNGMEGDYVLVPEDAPDVT